MKNFYFAITISTGDGFAAYVISANESDNLISRFSINNIVSANICETRKAAQALTAHWNECYRKNGTYLYDNLYERMREEQEVKPCSAC